MKFLSVFLLLPLFSIGQLNPQFVLKTNLNYSKVVASSDGMFGFEQDGKIGYMDKTGKVVIPAIYSYDSSLSNSQSIPYFFDGYVKIVKDRKQGLADKTGKIIIPIEHEAITPNTQYGNFVLVTKTIAGKKKLWCSHIAKQ